MARDGFTLTSRRAAALLNGNVDHEFAEALPIRRAGLDVTPSNAAPLDFEAVKRDVIVAPNEGFVLIVTPDGITGYDVGTGNPIFLEPLAVHGVVMAEWDTAVTAPRWVEQLERLPRW